MQYAQVNLMLRAMRPHQWIKNILVFFPFLLAHEIYNTEIIRTLVLVFLIMCLITSAVYIINDIFDMDADSRHPVKKNRPFAAGILPVYQGVATALILLCAGFALSLHFVSYLFLLMLAGYALLSFLYSTVLKKMLVIDVLALSFFYTLRILIGGAASGIPVSPWLLAFSWLFFLSISFVKRYVELQTCVPEKGATLDGRSYSLEDRHIIRTAGVTSGFLSVLIFLLYVATSEQVKALYKTPMWLWMVSPVFVYWLMRLWFLANRNLIDSDPVMFAIKDPPSWIAAGITIGLMVLGAIT